MVQLLFDSPEIRRDIIKLKTYALENPQDFSNGIPKNFVPAGDIPEHVIANGNMIIVYSVEIQPKAGICHHLSVSKNKFYPPNPILVNFVMEQLGMGNLNDDTLRKVWLEGPAVNIVQPLGK